MHDDYKNLPPVELVKLCGDNEPAAWEEFVQRYQRQIALTIVRTLRHSGEVTSACVVDDLVQDTYVAFCANGFRVLRRFVERYPDSLDDMIRIVAANATRDHLRRKNARKRGGDFHQVDAGFPLDSLHTDDYARIDRAIQLNEIDTALRDLPHAATAHRDRTIFWLHFQFGMTTRSIAQIPSFGLTSKGVESSIHRTLDLIRKSLGVDSGESGRKKKREK
jgi:RNA polymerase sigma-70 factor (ECF subfamily)